MTDTAEVRHARRQEFLRLYRSSRDVLVTVTSWMSDIPRRYKRGSEAVVMRLCEQSLRVLHAGAYGLIIEYLFPCGELYRCTIPWAAVRDQRQSKGSRVSGLLVLNGGKA